MGTWLKDHTNTNFLLLYRKPEMLFSFRENAAGLNRRQIFTQILPLESDAQNNFSQFDEFSTHTSCTTSCTSIHDRRDRSSSSSIYIRSIVRSRLFFLAFDRGQRGKICELEFSWNPSENEETTGVGASGEPAPLSARFPNDDAEENDGVALAIWRKLALKPRRNRVTSPPRK